MVVFSGIAPGQVIAATAFLPDTMTVGSAAWRPQPSGPDMWAASCCGIFEGSPPAGNVQERLSFPFNICLLDALPGEWVVLWAVVGHSPKGEEKEGAWGSHSLMLHCRIDGAFCS